MTKKISLGIIGCGVIFRLMHLPVLKKMENRFHIAGIFDTDPNAYSKAKTSMKKLRFRFDDRIFVKNADDILRNNSTNAVVILTGINSHLEYTLSSLNAGKNVFLEKPAALKVKEIQKMIELSKKKNKIVQVGMVLRHSRWFESLKKIIDSKKYGRVLWMHWLETRPFDPMNWRYNSKNKNGDAIIHDKAIHQINLFNSISGAKPESVFGMAGQYMLSDSHSKKLRCFNREAQLKGDSNDHLMTIVKYKNGVKADLLISYVSPHARESRWVIQLEKAKIITHFETFAKGSLGRFEWGRNPSATYLFKDNYSYSVSWKIPMSYPPSGDNLVFYDEYRNDPLHPGAVKQWEEFYESVTHNIKPKTDLNLALEDTKVVEAIDRSVKTQKVITII